MHGTAICLPIRRRGTPFRRRLECLAQNENQSSPDRSTAKIELFHFFGVLFVQFFFLDDGPHETHKDGKDGEQSEGMSMLLGAMEREEREAGASLMEQARRVV